MSTEATIDYEKMSMDDLRKAAEEEARKASTTTETKEEEVVEEKEAATEEKKEAVVEENKPQYFTSERTIDLGDGAGVQVFKGKGASREEALEDLSNKLAEAQRHATRKIREQEAKLKVHTEEPKVTPEDDAMLSEQLLKTPTEAFKKLFKQVTGVDITEFKTTHQKEKAFLEAQERRNVGNQFVASTPDYADTPRNGKLIGKWCELHNDFSLEGFNKAYQDLNESGLLDVKGEEASDEQKKVEAESQRIADAAKASSSQRTRKSSGLSTQRRTAVPTPTGPTEEELASMPMDKLRALANKQLAGQA